MSVRARTFIAGSLIVFAATAVLLLFARDSRPEGSPGLPALRLALLRAAAGDPDERVSQQASRRGTHTLTRFRRGTVAAAAVAKPPSGISFGQPTIAAVAGWGFEPDLRNDPTDPNRLYISAPDSGGSDTSWIWRSLDGGKTFKWVPAAAPLNGKIGVCPGGGDTELAVDPAGRLYFNDLSLANFSVARSDDHGVTFTPCNSTAVPDGGVDRQWYALDGDPTNGGSLYLTNDEVGPGAVVCGATQVNNVLVMYRSPAGGLGATAGLQFGPPNRITQPGTCDEGIMGNDEVSPVATRTGQPAGGRATTLPTAVRHVFVPHTDGSLTKIQIARCFPVAFGAPLTNVSDPSGLDCVDLPVADLGGYTAVRAGANFTSLAIDRAGNLYIVWEQAPMTSSIAGDSSLTYAYSTDEGNSWSRPIKVPTGLANNVFAWAAAGSDGRVDIAWYGAAGHVDPTGGPQACPNGGPDTVAGPWGLYLTQTLNGHAKTVTFSTPVLASAHPIRRGGIQTIMGNQCGGATNLGLSGTTRTLGDFFQLRIGPQGEARISYGDSDNIDGNLMGSHAMYVAQTGGPGVFGKNVQGQATPLGSTADPSGDATYDALGSVSSSMPNLDIVSSAVNWPGAGACHPAGTACLRVTMKVANMSLAAPVAPDTDTDVVWQTQWLVPAAASCTSTASTCANGGANFMVYAESFQGGSVQCFVGQNAIEQNLDGLQLTYPGSTQITDPGACTAVPGPGGTITIEVPLTAVSLDAGVAPYRNRLYSVTASTMTMQAPANTGFFGGGVGGLPFNLIDVAPGYDAAP